MDFLYLTVVEATDLLQKLSLDSDAKTIDVPDAAKKVFSCFFAACLLLESTVFLI